MPDRNALIVSPESPRDASSVHRVHQEAFGRSLEADLVDALRTVMPRVSIVAWLGDAIVGHILFTPVTIAGAVPTEPSALMGLGPMAVLPEHQRAGVGSTLVRHGLEACRLIGARASVVLGHPDYYPRFGFVPARPLGLACEFPAPDEAWLVAELEPGGLRGVSGTVRYRPEFAVAT